MANGRASAHVAMSGWFGIRGIGSLFSLLFVLQAGLDGSAAQTLVSLTLWAVAMSLVFHGLTARSLLQGDGARLAA
ncbi:MAG TPA: hypothetical protein VFE82_12075 [Ramlibacter sp.]|uniref:hypothetical protein n=1 Tax=Ramlibacter sp. TaxID=1917967 RepID=UPI002D3F3948|nr:hypothetical protein [Ramlibacter sp.]HZY19209.1 hypothetical protein [Ramlibacter sp.]